jgi:hypothetical protein
MATRNYASDITDDWAGFCALWKYIGAHNATYGQPPHYRKTAQFLAAGGVQAAAMKEK